MSTEHEHGNNTLTYFDSYCERAGDMGLWAEPLNAITNIAFLLAAYFCFKLWREWDGFRWRQHGDMVALTATLAVIGIGSGLWHTHVAHWSLLADVLPITLFIHIYLIASLRRLFGLSWNMVPLCWLGYMAVQMGAELFLPASFLNGTIMYIPTYATLLVMTAVLLRQHPEYGKVFAMVVAVWTASLFFRTVDLELCDIFPYGTHLMWHILNSFVLYRLLALLVQKARAENTK